MLGSGDSRRLAVRKFAQLRAMSNDDESRRRRKIMATKEGKATDSAARNYQDPTGADARAGTQGNERLLEADE